MCLKPERTQVGASLRIPEIIVGGVSCEYNSGLAFFGLPMPSFIKSQFKPSILAYG